MPAMKKILIADDGEDIRELIHVTLEDEGYDLSEAVDGNQALEKARAIRPDLIILDVMMPGKTGYVVCEELKKDPATKNIFILFLTARGSPISQNTANQSGGDAYMTKPFEPSELRVRVKKALGII
jgi:two-component system phosphate regulon response regulator PhoB